MDRRLLNYYNRELQHLREVGAEFAREYPKIASRLGMEGVECADPYVKRGNSASIRICTRAAMKLKPSSRRST